MHFVEMMFFALVYLFCLFRNNTNIAACYLCTQYCPEQFKCFAYSEHAFDGAIIIFYCDLLIFPHKI